MTEWVDPYELDPYQQEAVDFTIANGRVFIPLPVGAGKTCIPLKASRDMPVKTITVLCLGNSLWTWYRQMKQWRPDLAERMIVVEGMTDLKRRQVWNDPYWRVIIGKVATFRNDYPHITSAPTMLILDECQKYMRNRDSKAAEVITEYAQFVPYCVFTTGTGVSRGRQEFFPALQALRLKRFKSYWRFVNNFSYVHRGQFGMEIMGPRNTEQFRDQTIDTILRLKNPITGLPPINRQPMDVQMTPVQAKMYNQLQNELYMYTEGGSLVLAPNTLALVIRLRQTLLCPKILDPDIKTYGGGIEAVLDHMDEDDDRKHCVWFTPFTAAIPFMQDVLNLKGYHKQVVFRHGMDMNDLKEAEDYYRLYPDSVAICSIMFSQSFELETGNPAYFLGYSFNPDDNEQGEGRLRRKTTTRDFVNAYYIRHIGTYDERTMSILNRKTLNTQVDVTDMHGLKLLLRTNDDSQDNQ